MSDQEKITAAELLRRAESDELLTVADLEYLLAAQGTTRSTFTVRDWLRCGRVPYRKLAHRPGRERDSLRLEGHVVLSVLQWQRRRAA